MSKGGSGGRGFGWKARHLSFVSEYVPALPGVKRDTEPFFNMGNILPGIKEIGQIV